MCGIGGIYGRADPSVGRRIMSALAHRGPDGKGVYTDQETGLTLIHTRLAILDPTPAANQPLQSPDGRFVLVYNGELYNHEVLRARLRKLGHTFQTRSDTEVLLCAFREWGPSCLRELEGMFAFALADRFPQNGGGCRLYLVRDRLGIKPLLFSVQGNEVWFASELRGLIAASLTPVLDRRALVDYLAWGTVCQPRTMLEGVRALAPGSVLQVQGEQRTIRRYWDLRKATAPLCIALKKISDQEATERLQHHLEDAVSSHLVSDVPVGVFLSGGLDSTIVAALAARTARPLRTFCVGFSDSDERATAAKTASILGTQHQELIFEESQASEFFERVIQALDQPSVDGSNSWLASRLASREVKVVLSGLGADELFNGYRSHLLIHWGDKLFPRGLAVPSRILDWLQRNVPICRKLLYRLCLIFNEPVAKAPRLRRLMSDYELLRATQPGLVHRIPTRQFLPLGQETQQLQNLTYAELTGYLRDTLLRDSDVMSMAHSLELRPVFLDHRLVEFASALPDRFRIRHGVSKWLLRRVADRVVPGGAPTQPKRGFDLPFSRWMSTPLLKNRIRDLLNSEHSGALFVDSYRSRLESKLLEGRPPAILWPWAVLMAWLEKNQIAVANTNHNLP